MSKTHKSEEKVALELCTEIPEIKYRGTTRIKKKKGERGLTPFVRWIKGQANGWCRGGLCANGSCKGHHKNTRARLVKETKKHVTVRFSTTLFCGCS